MDLLPQFKTSSKVWPTIKVRPFHIKQLSEANKQTYKTQQSQHYHSQFIKFLAPIKFYLPQVATVIRPGHQPLNIIIRGVFEKNFNSLFFVLFWFFFFNAVNLTKGSIKRMVKGSLSGLVEPDLTRLHFRSMVRRKIYTMLRLPKYNVLHTYLMQKIKL